MAPSRRFIVTCSHHCHCHRANVITTTENEHAITNNEEDSTTRANKKPQSILPTPPSSPQLTSSSASASSSPSSSSSAGDVDDDDRPSNSSPSTTPALSRTAAVASSSSSVSSFATYNAKADNNTNNNALDATTTRTGNNNYYYRHHLRRVLSVEFIHDIEADTIDVPWSSSPPSPLLTQSPLSQQQDFNNKHEHEIEYHELEHGPYQDEDYLTAAPALTALAHVPPIPLRPAFTHRPSYEPNPIQVHYDQGLSILDHDDDDDDASTVRLEPSKQEPAQDDDNDDVSVTLDVVRATAKTEIALWMTQSCSSSSSSLVELPLTQTQTQTQKTSTPTPNLDRVPFFMPFLPLPVPVKFVSAQGPGVPEQPSDQSASLEMKVHQAAAPISGTERRISNIVVKEKENEGEGNLLSFPFETAFQRTEENIFSRRFSSEDQKQPSSIFYSLGATPTHSHSHSPTCQLQQQQHELDQGHQQDPSGLTISHNHSHSHTHSDNSLNHNPNHNHSHGDLYRQHQHKYQHLRQSSLWSVLPHDLEVKAALDECLGDIYHFTSSAPNSITNSRYSTTSQDDTKSVYDNHHHDQFEGSVDQDCDAYHDYQAPLPSPPLLKVVAATTIVTAAVADAILDHDKLAASSPQQLYQQLLSSSPTSLPPVTSSVESTKSLSIASVLPPPVAFLVVDQKDDICAEVTEDLDSKDLPSVLLLPGQEEDLIEQYPRIITIKRTSTDVVDKKFLNGLFAGTLSRWTNPTPTTAPVPPIIITASAIASTTSPVLRRMNVGRGRAAQSGDLVDMDPFWDF
ncbi:hypothetical protein BGZ47_002852 [Haplosporangium gracile]|nr:hypothetical protein BGZ47_002852 [Haplosporangium gracile]